MQCFDEIESVKLLLLTPDPLCSNVAQLVERRLVIERLPIQSQICIIFLSLDKHFMALNN